MMASCYVSWHLTKVSQVAAEWSLQGKTNRLLQKEISFQPVVTSCFLRHLCQGAFSHSWKQLLPDFGGGRVVMEIPRLTANASHGRSGEMGEHDFTVKMHRWLQPALPSKQPNECCPSFWTAWRVRGRPQVNRIKKGVCFLFLGLPPISLCRSIAVDRSCASCCCHCCCSPWSFKKCKQSRRLTFWQRLKQIRRPF